MNNLTAYLPFLVPIAVIEVGLAVAALVHLLRHRHYRFGNVAFWTIIVLLFDIVGPILYFTVGRGDEV